jgi:hypothetical protein
MSRGVIIFIVVLCGVLAALLFMPKPKPSPVTAPAAVETGPAPERTAPAIKPGVATAPAPAPATPVAAPMSGVTQRVVASRTAPVVTNDPSITNLLADPGVKPLPVLERDYLATTNRDTRLDLMMDITETPTSESVKALARLFQAETDTDLKVDLIDSLLGIDGFRDEKLAMLSLAVKAGLPKEVRESAIDGLIDLEDTRSISLLNGLLNDPDPEIRESAQDAIELLQTPAATPKLKPVGK